MDMEKKMKEIISSHPVVIFSDRLNPFCVSVKQLFFLLLKVPYKSIELGDDIDTAEEIERVLLEEWNLPHVPNVFIGGKYVGNYRETWLLYESGKLLDLLIEAKAVDTPEFKYTQGSLDEIVQRFKKHMRTLYRCSCTPDADGSTPCMPLRRRKSSTNQNTRLVYQPKRKRGNILMKDQPNRKRRNILMKIM